MSKYTKTRVKVYSATMAAAMVVSMLQGFSPLVHAEDLKANPNLNLNQITVQTTSDAKEKTPASTEPDWDKVPVDSNADFNVLSTVTLSDGKNSYTMKQYQKGCYETKLSLKKGSYSFQVLIDGQSKETKDQFQVDSDDTAVYLRYQDGKLYDSIQHSGKNGVFHSETWVGSLETLNLKTDGNSSHPGNWAPADSKLHLDYLGGGIYQKTFTFDPLAEETHYEYKVAEDDAWDTSYGSNGNNISLTLPKDTSSLTILVNTNDGKVYDSINQPEAFDKKVQIIGDARNSDNTDTWLQEASGYEFTQLSDDVYVYSDVYQKSKVEYKLLLNGQWFGPAVGNYSFSLPAGAEQNVTFVYNDATGLVYDSINNPTAVAYYLGASVKNVTSQVVENSNHTYQFIRPAEDNQKVTLHYALQEDLKKSGDKAFQTIDLKSAGKGKYDVNGLYFGDRAGTVLYYYEINGKRVQPDTNTITVGKEKYNSLTLHKYEGRTVTVPGTFPGESWNPASNQMKYLGNQRYQLVFKNVPAGNYEYKIAIDKSWSENYGADGAANGGNVKVAVPETKDVTVLYNDMSHRMVTSVEYTEADIRLNGSSISEQKFSDDNLSGIYSAAVELQPGEYNDIKAVYDGKTYIYPAFTLTEAKTVHFYFDPTSLVFYDDASSVKVETENISYDTEKTEDKSIWGAVPTDTDVTFHLTTGTDVSQVRMVVKGKPKDQKNLELKKDEEAKDGKQSWTVTTRFSDIGELTYYFVISNGSDVITYGDDDGYYGSGKTGSLKDVKPYDLVIYQKGYKTPDWMKNAVIYQIFPDRFSNGDPTNDFASAVKSDYTSRGTTNYELMDNWYALPENPEQEAKLSKEDYEKTGAYYGDQIWNNEIYGGDIKGITEHISYLKALGVNVIYLNPSFASISSHRYDTSDYGKIDPILGTEGDFNELVKAARANHMHIILDGVFNHVSDDSIYFDRYYKYLEGGTSVNHGKIGAYPYWAYVYDEMNEKKVDQAQAEKDARDYFSSQYGITDFSYTKWFDIENKTLKEQDGTDAKPDEIGLRKGKNVYSYSGWWSYSNMPVIKATNGSEYQTGSWAKEIIGDEKKDNGSITQYWMEKGTSGWRLDVANEVSDETWQHFRKSVKALNDGTNDGVIVGEIWTDATKYLLGDMYDSVMNYMFRGFATNFAMSGSDEKGKSSDDIMKEMRKLRERYPKEAFYAMMNLVDSHDTTRILSYLDGISDDRADKSLASAFPTYDSTSEKAKKEQYLVSLMQFTYAGAPTIYYGDELGMVGADDPDDRRAMTWGKGNRNLTLWYAWLGYLRNHNSALRTGTVEEFSTGNKNVLGYIRRDQKTGQALTVLLNNSDKDQEVTLDLKTLQLLGTDGSETSYQDLLDGSKFESKDGKLIVSVPAYNGRIMDASTKDQTTLSDSMRVSPMLAKASGKALLPVSLLKADASAPSMINTDWIESKLSTDSLHALEQAWDPKYKVANVDHEKLKKEIEEASKPSDPSKTDDDKKNPDQGQTDSGKAETDHGQAETDTDKAQTDHGKAGTETDQVKADSGKAVSDTKLAENLEQKIEGSGKTGAPSDQKAKASAKKTGVSPKTMDASQTPLLPITLLMVCGGALVAYEEKKRRKAGRKGEMDGRK
ncbi:alpha-amylase family glycosyl hydrolase [Lachnospiraceae bacterium YH-ros2228]